MRRFAVLMVVLGIVAGCSKHSPLSPTPAAVTPSDQTAPTVPDPIILAGGSIYTGPLHHNIPVILPTLVDGIDYGFMCETKPRRYILRDGTVEYTLDHYVIAGKSGCPDTPID